MNKDICLIGEMYAPENEADYITSSRSLGVALLASCLRERGMSVDIIDPLLHQYTIDECFNIIESNTYKYFGFSVLLNFEYTKLLISRLRKAGYKQHFTMGGVFATTNYSNILTHNQSIGIDSIIIGEGEETIVELFEHLENQEDWKHIQSIAFIENGLLIVNPRRKRIDNLDKIPFPATDDVQYCLDKHMPISLYTSRGCPGKCLYCGSNNLLNDKNNIWIYRSANNVIEELTQLNRDYNISCVAFVDDNFIGTLDCGVERTLDICKKIVQEQLKINFFIECRPDAINEEVAKALYDAGCRAAFVGIESASDKCLKEIGRGTISSHINNKAIELLSSHRIEPMIGFMMITPETVLNDIYLNIDFFEEFISKRYVGNYKTQGITSLLFSELLAISGTIIRRHLENQSRIIEKNATYIPKDSNVYIFRSILHDHDLYQFMLSIEKRIRKNWIHLYQPEDIKKIGKIKAYERDLVLRTLKLFREVLDIVKEGDLSNITKTIILFKKEMISFSNETIKDIRLIIAEED